MLHSPRIHVCCLCLWLRNIRRLKSLFLYVVIRCISHLLFTRDPGALYITQRDKIITKHYYCSASEVHKETQSSLCRSMNTLNLYWKWNKIRINLVQVWWSCDTRAERYLWEKILLYKFSGLLLFLILGEELQRPWKEFLLWLLSFTVVGLWPLRSTISLHVN